MDDAEQKRIFAKNLRRYMDIIDKPQSDVAKAIGVSPQTFNTWFNGIALPRMGKVQALADYFHCNKSDLIEDKTEEAKAGDELSPAARELIDLMHQLEPEQIGLLLAFAKALLHRPQGS